jgi:UDP-N-acetylglucosamine/UDP-N-acetylgalactosamine diphosphorylase
MAAIKETVSNLIHKIAGSAEEAPREPSTEEFQALKKKYTDAGQGQVFAFVDELQTADKSRLFHQLSTFDVTRINELADKALNPPKTDETPATLEPLPSSATASIIDSDPADLESWYDAGLKQVAENNVAVVLMAGGQGTRLGSSAPKGCFDIGLLSEKSLFQLQAERIAKLQELANKANGVQSATIPWYVMTSGPTRKPTEEFFAGHKYFGLQKENVFIFEQGVLPCISNDGKIIMESKSKVRFTFVEFGKLTASLALLHSRHV